VRPWWVLEHLQRHTRPAGHVLFEFVIVVASHPKQKEETLPRLLPWKHQRRPIAILIVFHSMGTCHHYKYDRAETRYPVVFILPMLGVARQSSEIGIQIGYSFSDIISKCGVGLMVTHIAQVRSKAESDTRLLN
jgi:hypothetical protein